MANRVIAVLCLGAMAAMCGCAGPTGGSTASRVGPAGTPSHVVLAPENSFVKTWRAELDLGGTQTLKALYLRTGRVFAYTSDNDVYAFDRLSGSVLFAQSHVVPPGKTLWAPIVLADYMVFPTAFSCEVYSTKGDLVQSQQLPFSVTSNGCAGDGSYIFVGASMVDSDISASGRLACVDVADRYVPLVWSLVTRGVAGAPSFTAGTCYAGGGDGNLYAVDDLRHSAWSLKGGDVFKTDKAIVADVVADGASVYAASMDERLYCIDRQTGKLRWQYFAEVPLSEGPVVSTANIYLMVPGKGLVAIARTSTGAIRTAAWTKPDAVQFLAEDDRYTYLGMKDNSFLAVDKTSGQPVFQSVKTDFVCYAHNTNAKEGFFYAATSDGHVYQIKPVLTPGVVGEPIPQQPLETQAAGH